MKFLKSIRFKLTLWYLVFIAGLLGCFGLVTYAILSYQLHQNLDESLRSLSAEIENGMKLEGGQISFADTSSAMVLIYDANGVLVKRLGPNVTFKQTQKAVQLALLGQRSFFTENTPEGLQVRLFAEAFTIAPGTRVAVVVGKPPIEIQSVLGTVNSIFWASALAGVVLAAIGGLFFANRALNPVLRIAGTAEDIGVSNLNRRIEIHSEDEIGRLASTLNRMIDRLEAAFNRERQFAADASHELRTPLSVIQAEASLALEQERSAEEYRKSLKIVSEEVDYMSTVLGNLLLMIRNEQGREPLRLQTVNLADLLKSICAGFEAPAREKNLSLVFEEPKAIILQGDQFRLKQALSNIIDNAVRYTPAGGRVVVSAHQEGEWAVTTVSDTGIGIPEDLVTRIFERFYRVDQAKSRSRGGAGLGLAIAKHAVDAHGGRIEVNSAVGKGSTFKVFLPLRVPVTPSVADPPGNC